MEKEVLLSEEVLGGPDLPGGPSVLEEALPQGKYPCPCCGYITLPVPEKEALGYICPVCFWEIDLFCTLAEEKSDSNHGLTLRQAQENFRRFGAVTKELKKYCRRPTPAECEEVQK